MLENPKDYSTETECENTNGKVTKVEKMNSMR